jgi:hypothetical protein
MPPTMRISLLLIAVMLGSMLLVGCGSVNDRNARQRNAARLNPHDPMMTSKYLKSRSGR